MSAARQRLLDAAREVLERDGLEGLTLRAIARHAGVSHGAPLRHFPRLASLLAALSAWGFEQLVAAVDAAVTVDAADAGNAADTDARGRLARAGHGYVRFALAEPGVFAVMFRGELIDLDDPGYQTAAGASFAQLLELVAAAQNDGWHPDIPTDQLAGVLWARVHGLAELWLHGSLQAAVDVQQVDQLVELATGLDLLT
jgi:AcrR family transcriptional regulator